MMMTPDLFPIAYKHYDYEYDDEADEDEDVDDGDDDDDDDDDDYDDDWVLSFTLCSQVIIIGLSPIRSMGTLGTNYTEMPIIYLLIRNCVSIFGKTAALLLMCQHVKFLF